MTTFTNNWEFWLDENISPIISKWLMDEIKIKCSSFHFLSLNQTSDIDIYHLARNKGNVIIISKDEDYRELVAWKGPPPKLISIQFGNCSNKTFWKNLKAEIYDAIDKLIYGDLDIFDLK
jgi:predicted nuclease of predicted toxin-antitoxin system